MRSNNELERHNFERSWLARGGDVTDLERYPCGFRERGSGDVGDMYFSNIVQGHWRTWQAALASKQEQSDGETDLSHQR